MPLFKPGQRVAKKERSTWKRLIASMLHIWHQEDFFFADHDEKLYSFYVLSRQATFIRELPAIPNEIYNVAGIATVGGCLSLVGGCWARSCTHTTWLRIASSQACPNTGVYTNSWIIRTCLLTNLMNSLDC